MPTSSSPFPDSSSSPGNGEIHISKLPPNTPTYASLNYTYPLKLIPSTPHIPSDYAGHGQEREGNAPAQADPSRTGIGSVPLLFMITYGGGLLPGDNIDLLVRLDAETRLAIATQGSTKIYKSFSSTDTAHPTTSYGQLNELPEQHRTASQTVTAHLAPHAGLLYLPHPTQPFAESRYVQTQIFTLREGASLATIDWVTCGREARGERWAMEGYRSKTEVWIEVEDKQDDEKVHQKHAEPENHSAFQEHATPRERKTKRHLLLRDAIILEPIKGNPPHLSISARMEPLALSGTFILIGPLFASLSAFFLREFSLMPRIGARGFDKPPSAPRNSRIGEQQQQGKTQEEQGDGEEQRRLQTWREERWAEEQREGILWTAASVRGNRAVVVRFGARDGEAGRRWVRGMVEREGSVDRGWGKGAMGGLS